MFHFRSLTPAALAYMSVHFKCFLFCCDFLFFRTFISVGTSKEAWEGESNCQLINVKSPEQGMNRPRLTLAELHRDQTTWPPWPLAAKCRDLTVSQCSSTCIVCIKGPPLAPLIKMNCDSATERCGLKNLDNHCSSGETIWRHCLGDWGYLSPCLREA